MPLLEQVLKTYPEDVKLVFKNFPLSSHQFAKQAATAALAADMQGMFWNYHDALFANYNRLNDKKIEELAVEVGLDMVRFNKDRNDPTVLNRVRQDFQEGTQVGVRGTPTIFINGRRLQNRNLQGFKELIDAELDKIKQAGSSK